jgi:hypothetical protein
LAFALLRSVAQVLPGNEITARCSSGIYLPQRVIKLHPGGTTLILLIVILLLLMFATFPAYPYSRGWGYYPSGGLGTILLIVVILWLLHVI